MIVFLFIVSVLKEIVILPFYNVMVGSKKWCFTIATVCLSHCLPACLSVCDLYNVD